jgi:hypothetical protein
MSQTATATQPADPLTIKLQNGQVFRVESNESVEAEVIPIIDVSGMFSEKLEDRKAVAERIREACHRIGFFYVVNHV